jgi:hypothetical protein
MVWRSTEPATLLLEVDLPEDRDLAIDVEASSAV